MFTFTNHLIIFSILAKQSRKLKDEFDRVKEIYDKKLREQEEFRNRTERARDSAKKIQLSLIGKLRVIESKWNSTYYILKKLQMFVRVKESFGLELITN